MIYLIGGTPRVGKSLVAKKLAEATNAKAVSTDLIAGNLASSLTEAERKARFPLPGFSGTPSENTLSPEERVELQLVSARSVQGAIDELVAKAAAKNETLILEGVHLLPSHVRTIIDKYGTEHIQALFVGSTDTERIVDGIMKNSSPDNWMRDSNPEVIRQVAEFASAYSACIQKDARNESLSYKERTDDFEADIRESCGQLGIGNEQKIPLK